MRNKHLKNILLGVLAVGCTGCYTWTQDEQLEQTSMKPIDQKISEKLIASNKKQLVRSESDPAPTEHELLKMIADIPKAKTMYEVGKISNMAIKFYGRVIDQHGNPVAGAKVGVSLLRWRILDAGGEYHEFRTDSEGYFAIKGISGQVLTIRKIEKDGYEIIGENQNSQTFRVEGIRKNKSSPYIFQAWKKTEAEPLIYSNGFFGFYLHGHPYTIDLFKEKKIEGITLGDLTITFNRASEGTRSKPSDWSVVVKPLGGGVFETSDVFMNEAPNEGYIPSWDISFKKGAPGFRTEVEKHFYVKSRNGKAYSKVEMRFLPYYKDDVDVIEIKAWLNPNGSRNLQYDPSKRIPLKK